MGSVCFGRQICITLHIIIDIVPWGSPTMHQKKCERHNLSKSFNLFKRFLWVILNWQCQNPDTATHLWWSYQNQMKEICATIVRQEAWPGFLPHLLMRQKPQLVENNWIFPCVMPVIDFPVEKCLLLPANGNAHHLKSDKWTVFKVG